MAMNQTVRPQAPGAGFSAARRMQVRLNVVVAVAGAFLLVVLVNWFAAMRQYRRDISSFGGYGLSQRTREILPITRAR